VLFAHDDCADTDGVGAGVVVVAVGDIVVGVEAVDAAEVVDAVDVGEANFIPLSTLGSFLPLSPLTKVLSLPPVELEDVGEGAGEGLSVFCDVFLVKGVGCAVGIELVGEGKGEEDGELGAWMDEDEEDKDIVDVVGEFGVEEAGGAKKAGVSLVMGRERVEGRFFFGGGVGGRAFLRDFVGVVIVVVEVVVELVVTVTEVVVVVVVVVVEVVSTVFVEVDSVTGSKGIIGAIVGTVVVSSFTV